MRVLDHVGALRGSGGQYARHSQTAMVANQMTIRIEDLLNNRAVATDHMAGTTRRHGKVVGFGESDGRERIVPAEVSVTDGISHSISGQASNGEDDTIDACRILAAHLSSSELAYSEPVQ